MNNNNIVYKNSTNSVEERVEDLLNRMTIDEKVAQLGCYSSMHLLKDDDIDHDHMKLIAPNGIGQLVMMSGGVQTLEEKARKIYAIQKYFVEDTRLGIPAIPHIEALSGVMVGEATNFPAAIGQGATWNPEIIEEMTTIIRKELRALGYRQALSPVLDVARDMRWGRVGETYGEDPYLVSAIGTGFIKGLQSDELVDGVVATGKHFLGYANSERGLNLASENITDRKLYEIYAKPFEAAIHEANLYSVMNSYGEIDGVPIVASKEIFIDMLRDTMGFKGCVVSDYTSVERLIEPYKTAINLNDAAIQCLIAGLDVELPVVAAYSQNLVKAVNSGELDICYIDRAVRHVLDTKFRLGLFENPYPDFDAIDGIMSKESIKVSNDVASESMVLLKNDKGLLPLSKNIKKIAVIGPHGNSYRSMFGGYTSIGMLDMMIQCADGNNPLFMEGIEGMMPGAKELFAKLSNIEIEQVIPAQYKDIKTIKESIESIVDEDVEVRYSRGCGVKDHSKEGFDEAIQLAKDSDIVIMAMGGLYGWGQHCTSGESADSSFIGFYGVQEELIKEINNVNNNIVLVQMGAKPVSSEWVATNIDTIIEAWVPGQEGGCVIANTLFGVNNPGGKLPLTIPRNAAQMPVYYNPPRGTGNGGADGSYYINEDSSPLFCFGHGLSYTKFEYNDITLSSTEVDSTGEIVISVKLTNVGDYDGDEVVQVYFEDINASVVRPIKELVAFKRISVKKGECATIHFKIKMNQLGFYNKEMKFVVEPGHMGVEVGSSSDDIRLTSGFEITGETLVVLKERSYLAQVTV